MKNARLPRMDPRRPSRDTNTDAREERRERTHQHPNARTSSLVVPFASGTAILAVRRTKAYTIKMNRDAHQGEQIVRLRVPRSNAPRRSRSAGRTLRTGSGGARFAP